jgi:hypothetical protein
MKMKTLTNLILIIIVSASLVSDLTAQQLTKDQLIEDAREMKDLIESCHPDPYLHTGGKISFNFAFYEMLNKIPEKGMNTDDFWWMLSGFLAKMKDGHTYLFPVSQPDYSDPGGIPMRFSILTDSNIVVDRVSLPGHEPFIGCRVLKINSVDTDLLMKRVAELYPMENHFDHFRNLKVYLWYSSYMKRLFPDWEPGEEVEVVVESPDGRPEKLILQTGDDAIYKTTGADESLIQLPGTEKCDFVFDWLSGNKDIGYICLEKQDEFREYAEQMISGLRTIQDPATLQAYRSQYLEVGHKYYERYNGSRGPDSLELLINGMPSFTDFIKDVVNKLKENNTQNLIIDLRNNRGGVSLMSEILIYFLFGKEKMAELENDNYSITYLSELNTRTAFSVDIDATNKKYSKKNMVPLKTGDYDFFPLYEYKDDHEHTLISSSRYEDAGVFYKEYVSGEHSGFYTPENIYVLGGPDTFSAGFETLVKLIKCGASFAGVSAAQPGNCFGMAIHPVNGLKNSNIRLNVAIRRIVMFPDDPEKGYQLNPDLPLDLETFRKYNCDPNASVLMVLDMIKHTL